MVLALLKALDTKDLKTLVQHMAMAPLDIDLLLYEAQHKGEIKIDKEKGTVETLKEGGYEYDEILAGKIAQIISEYDRQEANITKARLEQDVLDFNGRHGYPIHTFVMTLYALENGKIPGLVSPKRYDIEVKEIKDKRPPNTFTFYTFCDHQEYGQKAVDIYIKQFEQKPSKKKKNKR